MIALPAAAQRDPCGHSECSGGLTLTSSDPEGSLSRYGRFFDLSLDMLCIVGFDGSFKRIKPAFERVTGYSAADILAAPFLSFLHPDDRDATIAEGIRLTEGRAMVAVENR